jgi:hypothetical protein
MDAYTFEATAGMGVQLRVTDVGQTSFYPYLRVYDPNGKIVINDYHPDVAAVDLSPSISGKYTVVVFDYSSGYASTGAYKIYFTSAPGSNDGGALDPTSPIDATLDEGDMDAYTLDATAGTGVQLRVTDVGQTSFYPYLRVYDPNGKIVTYDYHQDVAAAAFTASISGKYTVVVFDYSSGYASTGAYKIYCTVAPGSNEGGALTVGTPTTGTIELGDLDSYTFSAAVGNKLQVVATDVNATAFVPTVAIYDPAGKNLVNNSGATTATASFTAATAGSYTVVVSDSSAGYASIGDYSLLLTQN